MEWDYAKKYVDVSIPGYFKDAIGQFNNKNQKINSIVYIQHQEGHMVHMLKKIIRSTCHHHYLQNK